MFGRGNIDPEPISDSENSEDNTSSDEDIVSESDEDIVLNDNALSSDYSSGDSDTGEIEKAEPIFTVTRSGRTATTYKRAEYMY